jgi:hypothetical protein
MRWLFALVLAVALNGAESRTEAFGRVLQRQLILQKRDFTRAKLRQTADRFLREASGKARFAVLEVLTKESVRMRAFDGSAEKSLTERARIGRPIGLAIARVVVVKGRGVLQIQFDSGAVEHVVLGSYTNPLVFDAGGLQVRLIQVHLTISPLMLMRYSDQKAELQCWFTAERLPGRMEATALWDGLSELTGLNNLQLWIRTTSWFAGWGSRYMPYFEPQQKVRYVDWKEAPILHIGSYSRGIDYMMLDGIENKSVLLKGPRN